MKPILLLTAGDFGLAVGERAATLLRAQGLPVQLASLPTEQHGVPALVSQAKALAVAAWRPYVEVCRWIDDASFEFGVPWTLVELHGTRLTCGPVVATGAGPCYHCYHRRWASHHPAPEREMVLERAYARDPALGLPGFVTPMVEIAAAALLEDLADPERHAGRLRLVDVLSGAVQETAVLGIHACPRCGLRHAGPPGARFTNHLAGVVEALMS
jgi:bacteriocin biosynthesis cyclodehydratase domain-containing protein